MNTTPVNFCGPLRHRFKTGFHAVKLIVNLAREFLLKIIFSDEGEKCSKLGVLLINITSIKVALIRSLEMTMFIAPCVK
jgi:hypothetical protein